MSEHTAENGLPPLAVETHCIGCGHPNPTGLHIAGCAEAQRKLREPVQFAPVGDAAENDAPRCHGRAHTVPSPVTPGATCACGSVTIHADPVPPEDWCDHHPEWADKRGHCGHPECHVAGSQVRVTAPEVGSHAWFSNRASAGYFEDADESFIPPAEGAPT